VLTIRRYAACGQRPTRLLEICWAGRVTFPPVPGYRPEERIGAGGHGEVWRGRELRSGRPVALKLVRGGGADSLDLRAEVTAAAALGGPHVLRVLDLRVVGDDAVVVTEYAAGGSLAGVLAARGRLAPGEVVTVLAPLASVLAEAHGRLLIHGDVSPANILFTESGRPLLGDWGLARALAGPSSQGGAGTPGFTDPAVLAGASPQPASDVAALAAVGYVALAGQPPWPVDGTPPAALRRLAPLAPPMLAEAIDACLAPRAEDRPAAGEFATAVLSACDPLPVSLPSPGSVTDNPPTLRPGRSSAAVGSAGPPDRLGPSDGPGPPGGPDRPGRRTVIGLLAAIVLLVVLAGAAGVAWSRLGAAAPGSARPPVRAGAGATASTAGSPAASSSTPSPSTPSPSTPRSPSVRSPAGATPTSRPPAASPAARAGTDWRAVLQRLGATRARAFRRADPALLRRVYVPGVRPLDHDWATATRLREQGLRARGLRERVLIARLVGARPDPEPAGARVQLMLVDSLSAYRIVDRRTGRLVALGAARPREVLRVSLTRTAAGWRIGAVRSG
jgi:serine/threonine protein kinase